MYAKFFVSERTTVYLIMNRELLSKTFIEILSEDFAAGIVHDNPVTTVEHLLDNPDILANEVANFVYANKFRIAANIRKSLLN